MKCKYCGADNNDNATNCKYCNSYIKIEEAKPNTVINQNIYINNKPDVFQNTEQKVDDYQAVEYVASKKKHKLSKGMWIVVICCCLVLLGLLIGQSQNKKNDETDSNSVWAMKYTDIEDFDYYIDGDDLFIGRYKGSDKRIRINSIYTIDGKEKKVVDFNDSTFFCHKSESIIIPEGTKTLDSNTFNSSSVKFVYLPKTLEKPDNTFWGYFHNAEKIYYGGTEEQWNEICTVERDKLDCKEIVYNTDVSELK